ncbi:Homocysteine S-methyltransferase ybgG [Fimicolochytrium jonesii]|uniref:Homocysteine S-methyltransferase ybgG n=1 Tax=Fimicolochytrium jonesii TaxID=1396493 RepID=UPI0022FEA619|nr:Homocysteine S-methyltransferase ybgG [Fimicolochytrium jonesii]KAI8819983.1 Homocysteine S-methyltransferase ybgG [Fimicolochytrium jonesii]
MAVENPFTRFGGRPVILDGGLATDLETHFGKDLSGGLWSAKLLREDQESIKAVHRRYFDAGADVATTSSYQASLEGFASVGISHTDALRLMRLSITLAIDARSEHMANRPLKDTRPLPLIAASVGCYATLLADGSEYTGIYPADVTEETISAFHISRVMALLGSESPTSTTQHHQPDIIAFETIPSLLEARALALACSTHPILSTFPSWVTFTCQPNGRVAHGEKLADCIAALDIAPSIVAVGINCTDPALCEDLVRIAATAAKGRTVIVYANSGEVYDGVRKTWIRKEGVVGGPGWYAECARRWVEAGADAVGGCCRTGPEHVRAVFEGLRG